MVSADQLRERLEDLYKRREIEIAKANALTGAIQFVESLLTELAAGEKK